MYIFQGEEALVRGYYTPHVSIYFILMTLSTIGYGEYAPVSPGGRIFMICVIVYVLVIKFTAQLNELIRLMDLKSVFQQAVYRANPEVGHLVITGQVKLTALRNVALELFHPDHGIQDRHAVVLQQHDPSNETQQFLHDPKYSARITWLTGNPMKPLDLLRSELGRAKAVILMANKDSTDPETMDHKNILIGLAMKKYVQDYRGMHDNEGK